MNNQETLYLFQAEFNVMAYSFNTEYELNDDRAEPTLSVPKKIKIS